VDIGAVRRWVGARSRPTAIDLFSGAGGLSLGLHRAGFDVIVGADSDAWAIHTHAANLPGMSWCGDLGDPSEFLQTLDVWGIDHVDLVAGGVPCQPFSRAAASRMRQLVNDGARGAYDARADLWESFIAVVDRLRPAAVLVENVPDLPRWDDGAVLIGLYESLRTLGYRVEARILDGFRHGVPQHRQRLILIGGLAGREPVWPEPDGRLVSLRDAIGDLPPIPRAQRAETLPYDPRRTSGEFQKSMREGLGGDERLLIRDHICRDVRADDMEAFRLLREGQTYIDLPERLRRYRSDVFTDKYKRLTWNELCRSITAHIAKDGYWYIHPDQHRTLSIREAARVQTFPDDFRFAGTQTHRYRQIGNAVPVSLAEAVGGAVMRTVLQPARPRRARRDGLRDLLCGWHERTAPPGAPWRDGASPWHVLLGELCLTRARAADAEHIHRRLLEFAPTPSVLLARQDPERRLFEIGLKERARMVVDIAAALIELHDGRVPDDHMALRELPGVGDHVCQAVLTFAFGRRSVLLDSATARVAGRILATTDDRRFQRRLDLHRLSGADGPDAAFNRALLALGRTVCRPVDPDCGICPLQERCRTGRARLTAAPTTLTRPAGLPAVAAMEVAA
jgi:DNA (cytosine-5)-methyltransferase 1